MNKYNFKFDTDWQKNMSIEINANSEEEALYWLKFYHPITFNIQLMGR